MDRFVQRNVITLEGTMSLPNSAPDIAPAAGSSTALGAAEADASHHPILERARSTAADEHRGYAGNVTPHEAIDLVAAGLARLVDVRTPEERKFDGCVPDSVHVAWTSRPDQGTAQTDH